MKIQSIPKELLAEILHYMADDESLEGLGKVIGEVALLEDVRAALRELAVQLAKQVDQQKEEGTLVYPNNLSASARALLSSLSPTEERRLLKSFGYPDL